MFTPAPFGSSFAIALMTLALAAGCIAATENSGCTRDNECAERRICSAEGRCVERDGQSAATASSASDGGLRADSAANPTSGGTIVDRCDDDLKCVLSVPSQNKIEDAWGKLRKVDGKCYFLHGWMGSEDEYTSELTPDGRFDDGQWTSDSEHFVGGPAGMVYDCKPIR